MSLAGEREMQALAYEDLWQARSKIQLQKDSA
jgi:hypothetical protein